MTHLPISVRRFLWATAGSLGVALAAHAQTYELNRFLSGGGGGSDPKKQAIATRMGAYICVGVSPDPSGGARFTLWSSIPERNSRIRNIAIDTGRHSGLFTNLTIKLASPSVKAKMGAAMPHAFLPRFSPKYWIDIPAPSGIAPGNMIVLSATLGAGKSFADVVNALNEGINPATASTGLRIGVVANYLLGGPPPGVGTIQDDGGFVTSGIAKSCSPG